MMQQLPPRRPAIAKDLVAVVLAGGMSRRMQGLGLNPKRYAGNEACVSDELLLVDKALVFCAGKPLISWTLQRLQSQVRQMLISCNRNIKSFASFGHPLLHDEFQGFAGPLAGVHAALSWMRTNTDPAGMSQWLLTAPCDCPLLPENLARSMCRAAQGGHPIVVARDPEFEQPGFLLIHLSMLDHLDAYLRDGGRKIGDWYQSVNYASCLFGETHSFLNVNTPEDVDRAARLLMSNHFNFNELIADIGRYKTVDRDRLKQSLLSQIKPIDQSEWLGLEDLSGHILSSNIHAPHDVPAHDHAAMDGFALRFKDLASIAHDQVAMSSTPHLEFPVWAQLLAGQSALKEPPPVGHALQVTTGAALPEGFDVVVPKEDCSFENNRVWIPAKTKQGQHIRQAAEDLARGDIVIQAGTRLSPIEVGLIASLGLAGAEVRGRLQVGLMSTGNELLDPTDPHQSAQAMIFDSNRYVLRSLLARWPSVSVVDAGIIPDDPVKLARALVELGESSDLILSSGGVSVGEADYNREVIAKLGQIHVFNVAMKPGKNIAIGQIGRSMYIGLPGNPVAAAIGFWCFVQPSIETLLGLKARDWPLKNAIAGHRIGKKRGRTEFQRGWLEITDQGQTLFFAHANQSSAFLTSLSRQSSIAVLGQDAGSLEPGEAVQYVLVEDLC